MEDFDVHCSEISPLKKLFYVEPPESLLQAASSADFKLGLFTNGYAHPKELIDCLESYGLEPDEDGALGMLFASLYGVTMHSDELPAILWVVGGSIDYELRTHEFIVDGEREFLEPGYVYLFDARMDHGVISSVEGLWCVFSTYIKLIDED